MATHLNHALSRHGQRCRRRPHRCCCCRGGRYGTARPCLRQPVALAAGVAPASIVLPATTAFAAATVAAAAVAAAAAAAIATQPPRTQGGWRRSLRPTIDRDDDGRGAGALVAQAEPPELALAPREHAPVACAHAQAAAPRRPNEQASTQNARVRALPVCRLVCGNGGGGGVATPSPSVHQATCLAQ